MESKRPLHNPKVAQKRVVSLRKTIVLTRRTLANDRNAPQENEPQMSDSVREAQLEVKNVPPTTNVAQKCESLASTDRIDGSLTSNNNYL